MTWTTRPRSDAGSLAMIAAGEGVPVLLIHGVGLCADAWGAQIDALSQRGRIMAVDLPGHGQSAPLDGAPTLTGFTDRIAEAVKRPGIVVGHSFGAMIALDMAIRYPRRVNGVVALNAIYRRNSAAQAAVMARANGLDGRRAADPTATLQRWFGDATSRERSACKAWLQRADPAGYRDAYQVFARADGPAEADLRALACPALFVTGDQEPNSTPDMSHDMAALAPKGRADIIAGAAHMLPMTHAAQLNALLTTFVQTTPERT